MPIQRVNCTLDNGTTIYDGRCSNRYVQTEVHDNGQRTYDHIGAMHFIIAVVLVYGVAVMGVFVLSYFRRKKLESREIDKQANTFLREMPNIRLTIEKQERLCSIQHLLPDEPRYIEDKIRMATLGNGILKYVAVPLYTSKGSDESTNDSRTEKTVYSKAETEVDNNNGRCIHTPTVSFHDAYRTLPEESNWADILKEVDEVAADDLDDDVFMTSGERNSFGVDMYIQM